uniref:DUF1501 domain-containing protein n=1 Tax=Parastrongyloides trichosuri TaxID=131310 RepID=A0A0N4Z3T8_PARTI
SAPVQDIVDLAFPTRTHGQQHMRTLQPLLQSRSLPLGQTGPIRNTDQMFFKQGLRLQTGRNFREHAQGQINLAITQLGQHGFPAGLA